MDSKHFYATAARIYVLWLKAILPVLSLTAKRRQQPNIVIALADDLGWADVGYHELSGVKTAYIDRLAKEGIILTNHYVQPLCSPSRASLLTGKYPIHIGAGLNENVFAPDEVEGLPLKEILLSEKLKELGYKTALFGKWHLGLARNEFLPTRRGFDRFYGFYSGAIDYYTHNQTANRCHKTKTSANFLDFRDQEEIVHDRINEYSAGIFNEEALKFLHGYNSDAPFFLFMSYQNVHDPLQVPDKYSALYPDIEDKDRKIYAGMASYLDESMWNLTQALKNTGQWDNTLVIFMSDNGGNPSTAGYGWPLRGKKGTLWEGGIRSPTFLSGGYLKRSGFQSHALIHIVDWFPTILNIARGEKSNELSSKTNENGSEKRNRKPHRQRHTSVKESQSSSHQSIIQHVIKYKHGETNMFGRSGHQTSRYAASSNQTSRSSLRSEVLKNQVFSLERGNIGYERGDVGYHDLPASHESEKHQIDGVDVWMAITNENIESPRKFIVHNINNRAYAIRKGKWKLITEIDMGWRKPPEDSPKTIENMTNRPLDPKEFEGYFLDPKLPLIENGLYDILNDISEVNDCSKNHPEIVEDLLGIMKEYKKTMVKTQRVYSCNQDAIDNAKEDKAWGPFLD